jgi:hypothetical protein
VSSAVPTAFTEKWRSSFAPTNLLGGLPLASSFARRTRPGSSRCSPPAITLLVADVDADERPGHAEEFYDRQLIGLVARTADETVIGRVISVLHLPQQDLLELDTSLGSRLIPFVEALIPEIDLERGWLRIADVPGLLADEEG